MFVSQFEAEALYRKHLHDADKRLGTKGGWRAFVEVVAHNPHWSFSNQLAVADQTRLWESPPDVFLAQEQWQRLGYHPEALANSVWAKGQEADGSSAFFRVFDRSQVVPLDREVPSVDLMGEAVRANFPKDMPAYSIFERFVSKRLGFEVVHKPAYKLRDPEKAVSFSTYGKQLLVINDDASERDVLQGLLRLVVQGGLHFEDKKGVLRVRDPLERKYLASAVEYAVGVTFGLYRGPYHSPQGEILGGARDSAMSYRTAALVSGYSSAMIGRLGFSRPSSGADSGLLSPEVLATLKVERGNRRQRFSSSMRQLLLNAGHDFGKPYMPAGSNGRRTETLNDYAGKTNADLAEFGLATGLSQQTEDLSQTLKGQLDRMKGFRRLQEMNPAVADELMRHSAMEADA